MADDAWRCIVDTALKGTVNMARDYALLQSVSEGASHPVIRFYAWEKPAVTIGYFQSAEEETDISLCRRRGIDIIRRITGGGAVFHDKEITYSIIFPLSHHLAGMNILDSYSLILAPFADALCSYGLKAEYVPANDIEISGRKISGSAQIRRGGCILQHGTILCHIDRAAAFSCLTVPKEKTAEQGLSDPAQRVTALDEYLLSDPQSEEFTNDFIDRTLSAFAKRYNISFRFGEFTSRESAASLRFESDIFSRDSLISE
ncbi:MAG: lipoate--protein ligase family protein [Spirochaetota bacterium]